VNDEEMAYEKPQSHNTMMTKSKSGNDLIRQETGYKRHKTF
jgi:hypothetical protein